MLPLPLLLQASLLASAPLPSHSPMDITKSWGAYTPYFAVEPYKPPPSGCIVDQVCPPSAGTDASSGLLPLQVHILERHGARFPTSGSSATIVSAVDKLQSVATYTDPRFDFLKTFVYDLGIADLVPFGALQAHQSGELAYKRYRHLIAEGNLPFVRASSGQRVVDSATNWTAGFAFASNHVYNPPLAVVLPEDGNNTLDDAGCPNAGSSDVQTNTWLAIFAPPITARLNAAAPGANITDPETYALISLCAFHTVGSAPGRRTGSRIGKTPAAEPELVLSPFCALFTDSEFADFEYSMDLDKYYGTGYGAHLGRPQGIGYTNELLARLTRTPVNDSTQTNSTLDCCAETFPLDRALYADFSHDNEMVAIWAAMGLFKQKEALDPTGRRSGDGDEEWVVSRMVPFSGRMVVERLVCRSVHGEEEARVRILVNDAVQPLEFCSGGSGSGVCPLEAFVESQGYARRGGDGEWEMCFEE
ncbi:Phosphoglycerate mutase-like protein [Mycena kentingensis (nom. inval.)]|nr:Phosphoglycerate mutase-like protein [Mycena kentingensis (nom. inval.)]